MLHQQLVLSVTGTAGSFDVLAILASFLWPFIPSHHLPSAYLVGQIVESVKTIPGDGRLIGPMATAAGPLS